MFPIKPSNNLYNDSPEGPERILDFFNAHGKTTYYAPIALFWKARDAVIDSTVRNCLRIDYKIKALIGLERERERVRECARANGLDKDVISSTNFYVCLQDCHPWCCTVIFSYQNRKYINVNQNKWLKKQNQLLL